MYRRPRLILPEYATFLTTMLLGLWVARTGCLYRTRDQRTPLKKLMLASFAIGLRRLFGWLFAMGRMPLTYYLMQSVICTLLFYGYGFGLVDRVPPAAALLLSFVIWGLQIPLSVWWFKYFSFGPMEWVWRAASYLTAPSTRRAMRPAPTA